MYQISKSSSASPDVKIVFLPAGANDFAPFFRPTRTVLDVAPFFRSDWAGAIPAGRPSDLSSTSTRMPLARVNSFTCWPRLRRAARLSSFVDKGGRRGAALTFDFFGGQAHAGRAEAVAGGGGGGGGEEGSTARCSRGGILIAIVCGAYPHFFLHTARWVSVMV